MNTVNLNFLLIINVILFSIGIFGVILNRKNIIKIIMSIEIIFLSVNLNFIYFSLYLDDIVGYIFVLFILAVTAVESAIGLAIIIINYKLNNSIDTPTIFHKNNIKR